MVFHQVRSRRGRLHLVVGSRLVAGLIGYIPHDARRYVVLRPYFVVDVEIGIHGRKRLTVKKRAPLTVPVVGAVAAAGGQTEPIRDAVRALAESGETFELIP